ncbi:hypothetical protein LUZ62_077099 [Rhynchospora pubera]|uniref:Senescence regulator n=1 Tax=Rhynchospora pubera TaxID=906938 RepID=A0AAV8CAS5_9POAL|nr:hypothetical protein LUZ62_085832 [Rhynchospora pubera]KAJ4766724.1 hypothetical protein LUZ62_077099 [Rhynchospora pubera]
METIGPHRRSSSSDRYFLLFSPPPASTKPASDDSAELQEDDIFSTNNGSGSGSESDSSMLSRTLSSVTITPSSVTSASASRRHVNLDPPSGMLALLQDTKQPIASSTASSLHRKATIASATSASTARMIPAPKIKVKDEYALPHQSAPMNIPVGPPRKPRGGIWLDEGGEGDDYTDMSEMLPPHEIVARRTANTPLTASSCLEGVGRTLKGRDLRRVRNAVWRQTGFLD